MVRPKNQTDSAEPKPGARKVSPLRGMDVDAWIAALAPPHQAGIVRALIATARKAAPQARLSIKWGQPVFEENGPIAFIKPAKAHVTFGFWRGAQLRDPKGVLEGGEVMRHVKVRTEADIGKLSVGAFMREAVALNRAQGDPTARKKRP